MTKKITTSFNVDKAIDRIVRPSVFDRIIKEIVIKEVPARYITNIIVLYHDGSIIELKGSELTHPMPVNRNASWSAMEDSFKKIRDVKISINTDILESDVDKLLEPILGNYC